MPAELTHSLHGPDAGLRHHRRFGRSESRQPGGARQVNREVVEVPVVHAEDPRAESASPHGLLLANHFGEHVHPEGLGEAGEVGVAGVVKDGEHEQDSVGAEVARGVDLDFVDDEVLAEHGQVRA